MKQIYVIVLGIISFIGLLPGCVDDPEMDTRLQNAKAPEVSETTLEGEIGASSITLTAQIMQENGLPVTECGVCWSVQEQTQPIDNMRSSRFVKADRIEGHTFAATMSNLEDSTRYYVYAYAINDVDTAFSETEKVYTTIEGIGEVVTLAIDSTEVNATSALVKGEIKNRGVGITEMGFYYQKKENETGVPELSEQDSIVRYTGDLATIDTFSCRLTDLEPETWYYVRAFAKNQFGEFAFNVDSFRTTDGKPMVGNLRLIADSTTFTTADLSAYLLQEGDAEVSAYGFCWSEEEMPTMETDADTIICNNVRDFLNSDMGALPDTTRLSLKQLEYSDELARRLIDRIVYHEHKLTIFINIADLDKLGTFRKDGYINTNAIPMEYCTSPDGKQVIIEQIVYLSSHTCINHRNAGYSRDLLTKTENATMLIKALAYGWKYKKAYESGIGVKALASTEKRDQRTIYKYLNLAYLSPQIINSVLNGELHNHTNIQGLFLIAEKYENFEEQEKVFFL